MKPKVFIPYDWVKDMSFEEINDLEEELDHCIRDFLHFGLVAVGIRGILTEIQMRGAGEYWFIRQNSTIRNYYINLLNK